MEVEAPLNKLVIDGVPSGKASWVHTSDGIRLRAGIWSNQASHKGTVFIFPGRSEYLERFGRTTSALLGSGFAVVSLDWRGHGLSDRIAKNPRACHVTRFTYYQKDVAAIIELAKAKDMPQPWFLFGNSMGGCIGLRALYNDLPVAAAAFTAPLWDIKMSKPLRAIATPISVVAHALGRSQSYVPGYNSESYVLKTPFSGNKVTHDQEAYDFLTTLAKQMPEFEIGGPTMGWLQECLKECKFLSTNPSPDIPCLAFCGDQDEVVEIGAINSRMQNWRRGKFELVQGAKHELVMESSAIRDNVLGKTEAFFKNAL